MALKKRSLLLLPLTVLLFALLGGFFGPRMQVAVAASGADAEESALGQDVDSFTKVYSVVEQNFADRLNADKSIYRGAIPGMLRTLDPHSNFFDPKDYRLLLEEQKGAYFGVGMQVSSRNGKTVIMWPFPGSPAYKAGLRPGDVISFVNDKSTENMTTNEVADLLKGPRGTLVKIAVMREGSPDYLTFTVMREEIRRTSVPLAFWAKPGIAYIKILSFGEGTAGELDAALRRLGEDNIKGLILDLRNNPGGLLNSGVAVADHFLQKGQVIVSHRGRTSLEKTYTARSGNHGHEYPMVVLVDQMSASAAEIVSGALQDHDRAWILGVNTFGKGLVQTVYPLREGTGMALTTAHFYTPSGRLIQRDYTHESFYDYYFHKDGNTRDLKDVRTTDSGRTVYGGGGITPDEKYEVPKMDRLEAALYRTEIFSFTRNYFSTHSSQLPQGWMPDNTIYEDLHDYLLNKKLDFTEAEFTRDHDWIMRYLAREMYIYAFNVDDSDKVFAKTDPEVQKAIDAMPKATALIEHAGRVLVQR